MANLRITDLDTFYTHLSSLERKIGWDCRLKDCVGSELDGKPGVYFFFEEGETRSSNPSRQRVVHVGNSDDLGRRFSAEIKDSNESGAILRKHIGSAISGRGSSPLSEFERKSRVSNHIGKKMRLLYVFVSGEDQKCIKKNSIALLSVYNDASVDGPSPGWLGQYRETRGDFVRNSGLWNCHYVKSSYNSDFLPILDDCISKMRIASSGN